MAQSISTKYAAQLSNNLRKSRGYISNLSKGISITDNDNLVSFKITNRLQNDASIFGNSLCKYAEIVLLNPNNTTYTNLLNDRFELFTGLTLDYGLGTESVEYLSQGIFRVLNVKQDTDNQTLTLEAYDAMVRFNVPYTVGAAFPQTLGAFAAYLATSVGLELGNPTFTNYALSLTSAPNVGDNETTIRKMIEAIAAIAGGNAIIGRDNKLYFINWGASSVFTITPDLYYDLKIEPSFGPINSVIMSREPIMDIVSYPDPFPSSPLTYRIINCPLADDQRTTVIDDIYAAVNGIQYNPFKISWRGTGHLDFCDYIIIEDVNGTQYRSYVMNQTLTFDGSLFEELEAAAYTLIAQQVKGNGTINQRLLTTEAAVDKIDGNISLVVASVNGLNTSLSSLQVSVNGISSTVNSNTTGIGNLQSQINQSNANINLAFTGLNDQKSYYNFSADALTIGQESSPAQVKIGKETLNGVITPYLILTDGVGDAAKIQSTTMTVANIKVSTSAYLANHKITKLTGSTVVSVFQPI